ncbi:MAG: glycine oxidase ThiO [Cellvibrionaceae bacterium]|nr:glycine oxidase ThiO [Cellvibrionaceae bacterium]
MANLDTSIEPKNLAIVGAGIMGRCLAWRLSGYGHRITLFDKDSKNHGSAAAYTAAGMLAPFSELEAAEDNIFLLGQHSIALWRDWLKTWNAEDLMAESGTLVLAHRQDIGSLQNFNQQLAEKLNALANQQKEAKLLSKQQLNELEPELAQHFDQANFLKSEAYLDNHAVMDCMAKQLESDGITWRENREISAVSDNQLVSDNGAEIFDHIFDCRGLGAQNDIQNLRAVRGEVLRVYSKEVRLKHMVRLMHPRYRLYLVPKPNHEYVLGATQIESEDYSPLSVRSALELLSALYTIHPGFAEARIVETQANCRPALPDNQPLIKHQKGLSQINGLFRHGFLLAPALADITARLFHGECQENVELARLSEAIIDLLD